LPPIGSNVVGGDDKGRAISGQPSNPNENLLWRQVGADKVIDTAIDDLGEILDSCGPGNADNANELVSSHFVTTDGGYEFGGATLVKTHVADQDVRSDRLIERFRNALDGPGMFDSFDPGIGQGDLQRTPDMGTGIGMKKTDIIVNQQYCHTRAGPNLRKFPTPPMVPENTLNSLKTSTQGVNAKPREALNRR